MPAVTRTPESILPRSDSKNPATTCKGLTSNGRPCRRPLASPKNGNQGIIAVIPHVGHDTAAYFCWQHKDQAENMGDGKAQILDLQQRSSIDTLMEKLQVSDHQDPKTPTITKRSSTKKPPQSASTSTPGPLPSMPEDPFGPGPVSTSLSTPHATRRKRHKQQIHVSLFCCTKNHHEDSLPPARPRPAVEMSSQTRPAPYPISSSPQFSNPNQASTHATLENHLSYIPSALPHTTRTSLMTELSKPLTAADHEPGYIYIFWLTPKDVPRDAAQQASSLLQPLDRRSVTKNNTRRTSDVLREFNSDGDSSSLSTPRTIMLKIGRASNVHRRMIQWSQQCGHHITLLRYYPHYKPLSPIPSPSSRNTSAARDTSPSPTQKSPLVARVERLIHIELADKRVKRDCEGCGREHREWFEVDATRQGIREVDDTVRRWIEWAGHQKSPGSLAVNR